MPPTAKYDLGLGNDANTVLLLQSDKTSNSTSFTDNSFGASTGHVVTANGDIKHSVSHKFGKSAMYFDGTGDCLTLPDSDDWDFGSEDFTIDFWVNYISGTEHQALVTQKLASNYSPVQLYVMSGVDFGFHTSTTGSSWGPSTTFGTVNAGQWDHIAMVRSGNTVYLFQNGTLQETVDVTGLTFVDSDGVLSF